MMTSFHFCTLFKIRKKKKKIILSKQVNKYNICNISLSKKKKKKFHTICLFCTKARGKKKRGYPARETVHCVSHFSSFLHFDACVCERCPEIAFSQGVCVSVLWWKS